MTDLPEYSVVSIGSLIPQGFYRRIYSRHSQVLNFLQDDGVISLCTEQVCPGPWRLILKGQNLARIQYFELSEGFLLLNTSLRLPWQKDLYYQYPNFRVGSEIIPARVQSSQLEFLSKAPAGSVAKLVTAPTLARGGFDACLAAGFSEGIDHFKLGRYAEAVHCFKRRGYGLTPAGDDFLIGFLLGMAWLRQTQKKRLSKIMDTVLSESLSADALTNTFLRQAHALQLDQDWACFLLSLMDLGSDFSPCLKRLLTNGATSGADQLSGFYLACELFGD